MTRAGRNPRKFFTKFHRPQRITLTMTVYIPFLGGYWKHCMDVLKVCLYSLMENTSTSFDLMVFDNNSCRQTRRYLMELQERNVIQYLVLSDTNIRQVGAWNHMFQSAPGEIIVYSDSDILFLPGWLEASLEILEAFPKSGMVTAQPARLRPNFEQVNSSLLYEMDQYPEIKIEKGKLISESYLRAHGFGLGISFEKYREMTKNCSDVLLNNSKVKAYASSGDLQFLIPKSVVKKIFPLSGDKVSQIWEKVNEAGYWNLSTYEYLIHHVGNQLSIGLDDTKGVDWLNLKDRYRQFSNLSFPVSPKKETINPLLRYLLSKSKVKHFLKWLNITSYKLLDKSPNAW